MSDVDARELGWTIGELTAGADIADVQAQSCSSGTDGHSKVPVFLEWGVPLEHHLSDIVGHVLVAPGERGVPSNYFLIDQRPGTGGPKATSETAEIEHVLQTRP